MPTFVKAYMTRAGKAVKAYTRSSRAAKLMRRIEKAAISNNTYHRNHIGYAKRRASLQRRYAVAYKNL